MPHLAVLLAALACRPSDEDGDPTFRTDDSATADRDSAGGDTAPALDLPAPTPGNLLGDLRGKNVVLVHVDTLRADILPAYGGAHDTMPLLGRRPWKVLDGLVDASSWTAPSTGSLLTGQPPHVHGIRWRTDDGKFLNGGLLVPSLVTRAHDAGWRTWAGTGNDYVGDESGISAGFETVQFTQKQVGSNNLEALLGDASTWVDGLGAAERFFVYLQPMNMHAVYSPDPEDLGTWADLSALPMDASVGVSHVFPPYQDAFARGNDAADARLTQAIRDVYAEQFLGVDRALDTFLGELERRGRLQDTVVVLVSDHGETLNDSRDLNFDHGGTLRQELIREPFLVLDGGAVTAPARTSCVAENVDVLPTLLDAIGLGPTPGIEGRVLTPETCRTRARSVLTRENDVIYGLVVTDSRYRVSRVCDSGTVLASDLVADPVGNALIPLTAVPDFADWIADMDAYLTEIRAAVPGTQCGGG